MKFLAIENEMRGKSQKDFEPHLESEASKVWEYYKQGLIREIYFTKDSHEAVLILECGSRSLAEEILNNLPLVKNGLIQFRIEELMPYDGFERLFKN
ncbi:MAG: superoxide dismutase [Bacteroidetes bacterium]|nr:superoxide dismutase [Bacteroidota bacterium]